MPTSTSTMSGVPCRCPPSGAVLAGAPSGISAGHAWTSPHTRGIASAFTMVLASGRLGHPTAPSRNSTLRHRHSGPTRPPNVVKRQRSWGPVSPRNFATRLRPPCQAGNSPPHTFRLAHKRKHGLSGVPSQRCFARPKDPGECGQTPKTLSIPSSRADEEADDALGDIRPRHSGAPLDILSPDDRPTNS
ncbi:hypothetical protein T07_3717 [Trichinella nelsoni]|uniref:Uncharacterized protein n=1 Tax=Trichinella nelsoni TaxID=6336 RepID=A0A0V0S451_9BILA|nr:hypothetical protein T07_3717 [Trichinella nelsoni]